MRLGDTDILAQAKTFQSDSTSASDHGTLWENLQAIDQAVLRRAGHGVWDFEDPGLKLWVLENS